MQLPRYIDKLTTEMKESGNLEGILLTGLTKDGVDLMESYVDRTGDVQTASFCMLKVQNRAVCGGWGVGGGRWEVGLLCLKDGLLDVQVRKEVGRFRGRCVGYGKVDTEAGW